MALRIIINFKAIFSNVFCVMKLNLRFSHPSMRGRRYCLLVKPIRGACCPQDYIPAYVLVKLISYLQKRPWNWTKGHRPDNDGEDGEGPGEDPMAVWATLYVETSVSKYRTPNSRELPEISMLHLEGAKALIRSPAAASLYWDRVQLGQLWLDDLLQIWHIDSEKRKETILKDYSFTG